ncbi:unnamed protein product [Calicophoron daubneyi]|uniref:Uncharacterized protein n=1 Tax=Calicophoron daubneyi TaxID=300641 RepID=A0AAV2T1F6_CALDB
MNRIVHSLGRRIFPSSSVLVRFRRQQDGRKQQPSHEALREAHALGVLARSTRVRLELDSVSPIIQQILPNVSEGATVELTTSEVKDILQKSRSHLALVDADNRLPLFKLVQTNAGLSDSNEKLGIKLAKGERGKVLQMSVNIDDHMLGIRVKQARQLLESNCVVSVRIKLPRSAVTQQQKQDSAEGPDKEQQRNITKLVYEAEAKRFVSAFSQIPGASVRLIGRQDFSEIVILLRPTDQNDQK